MEHLYTLIMNGIVSLLVHPSIFLSEQHPRHNSPYVLLWLLMPYMYVLHRFHYPGCNHLATVTRNLTLSHSPNHSICDVWLVALIGNLTFHYYYATKTNYRKWWCVRLVIVVFRKTLPCNQSLLHLALHQPFASRLQQSIWKNSGSDNQRGLFCKGFSLEEIEIFYFDILFSSTIEE